jgi:hypothetical protein
MVDLHFDNSLLELEAVDPCHPCYPSSSNGSDTDMLKSLSDIFSDDHESQLDLFASSVSDMLSGNGFLCNSQLTSRKSNLPCFPNGSNGSDTDMLQSLSDLFSDHDSQLDFFASSVSNMLCNSQLTSGKSNWFTEEPIPSKGKTTACDSTSTEFLLASLESEEQEDQWKMEVNSRVSRLMGSFSNLISKNRVMTNSERQSIATEVQQLKNLRHRRLLPTLDLEEDNDDTENEVLPEHHPNDTRDEKPKEHWSATELHAPRRGSNSTNDNKDKSVPCAEVSNPVWKDDRWLGKASQGNDNAMPSHPRRATRDSSPVKRSSPTVKIARGSLSLSSGSQHRSRKSIEKSRSVSYPGTQQLSAGDHLVKPQQKRNNGLSDFIAVHTHGSTPCRSRSVSFEVESKSRSKHFTLAPVKRSSRDKPKKRIASGVSDFLKSDSSHSQKSAGDDRSKSAQPLRNPASRLFPVDSTPKQPKGKSQDDSTPKRPRRRRSPSPNRWA